MAENFKRKKRNIADLSIKTRLNYYDKSFLNDLYHLRYMTFSQIYENYYIHSLKDPDKKNSYQYAWKKINKLLQNGLIARLNLPVLGSIYSLTDLGVETVYEIIKEEPCVMVNLFSELKDIAYTASDIKISPSYIPHMLAVNNIFFAIKNHLNQSKHKNVINWEWKDSRLSAIKSDTSTPLLLPDASLTIEDTVYFIELDTGTERRSTIKSKLSRYNNVLSDIIERDTTNNYGILFFIEKPSENSIKIDIRIKNVRAIAEANLSIAKTAGVSFYCDTTENLINIFLNDIIPRDVYEDLPPYEKVAIKALNSIFKTASIKELDDSKDFNIEHYNTCAISSNGTLIFIENLIHHNIKNMQRLKQLVINSKNYNTRSAIIVIAEKPNDVIELLNTSAYVPLFIIDTVFLNNSSKNNIYSLTYDSDKLSIVNGYSTLLSLLGGW